ncbi:MAG: carboxypeptidase-like regulatory domain-containing protein [bacterium]
MKSHAVPQEIMSLEFKLFGNFMTLREFIFIAIGIAIAWFFYILKNTGVLPPILAWPAVITFGVGGALFGLVPFQDRTLEQWIVNFILAVRKPTLRIWKKPGFEPITKEDKEIVSLKSQVIAPAQAKSLKTTKKIVTEQEKVTEEKVEKKVQESLHTIDNTINLLETGLTSVKRPVPQPVLPVQQTQTVQPIQKPVQKAYQPQMIKKSSIEFLKPEEKKPEPKPISQQLTQSPVVEKAQTSRKVIELNDSNFQKFASPEQIPNLQQNPNTINMIVRDQSGKSVEGVVSVIKNQEGSPIRAAVSNDFGHVVNNNPLDNGKYKVTLTKEGFNYPEFDIELKGKNYPILDITAQ